MTKVQLRNAWFQLHKWIGILLALVLIPLSITGSMLVWDDALDRMVRPSHYTAAGPARLPASAYVEAARRALPPGSKIVSVRIGEGPVIVTATPPSAGAMRGPPLRLAAWIAPDTGQLIDSGLSVSPLMRWAHIFHGSLQIPGFGRAAVGWVGMAMLLSSLTGLWLWWPLTGSWRRGFRWRRQSSFNANLHHQIGFWIALPLGILSLTGVIIAWPQMTGGANGMRRPMQSPLAAPHLTIDQALAATSVKGRVTITWPTDKDPVWKIAAGRGGLLQVEDASGRIAAAKSDDRQRMRSFYRRLHDGTDMGLVWQIIIFLGGLAPAVLGVTGILMWLRARTWRTEAARRKALSAAQIG